MPSSMFYHLAVENNALNPHSYLDLKVSLDSKLCSRFLTYTITNSLQSPMTFTLSSFDPESCFCDSPSPSPASYSPSSWWLLGLFSDFANSMHGVSICSKWIHLSILPNWQYFSLSDLWRKHWLISSHLEYAISRR